MDEKAPPLADLLRIDVSVPDGNNLSVEIVQASLGALATSNLLLQAHNAALERACHDLKAQVDGLKAHYQAERAVPKVKAV